MHDLISRQAALEALDEQIEQCNKSLSSFDISMKDEYAVKVEKASLTVFRERLEYLPPAQPEIVRCRDCVYGEQDDDGVWFCRSLGCQIGDIYGNGFCADAERRTDEE